MAAYKKIGDNMKEIQTIDREKGRLMEVADNGGEGWRKEVVIAKLENGRFLDIDLCLWDNAREIQEEPQKPKTRPWRSVSEMPQAALNGWWKAKGDGSMLSRILKIDVEDNSIRFNQGGLFDAYYSLDVLFDRFEWSQHGPVEDEWNIAGVVEQNS
ncbi:MAG: hypothetical protein R3182_13955 [Draconibacterium sp.]|nr:hypothetical protein [Draconibacterium sp.]